MAVIRTDFSSMLSFRREDGRQFALRAAAVVLRGKQVLIHKAEQDTFFALPGGRGEFFEATAVTVEREMIEEIDAPGKAKRLLWVIENFFSFPERDSHEIGFYYLVELDPKSAAYKAPGKFQGREGAATLEFEWVDLDRLGEIDLRPAILKTLLKNIPKSTQLIVNDELSKAKAR